VIISRRNEPAIAVYDADDLNTTADPVRNGQRWHVLAVDPERGRIAARRLDDGARTVFSGDYLHQHVTHGYAVTVHSAQGVTAATTHAVLGENTTRALLYVALTRGRHTNHAYLYERHAGETEHEHRDEPGVHLTRRGTNRDAAQLVRAIIGTHNEQARTAHDIADQTTDRAQLPERIQHLLARRATAIYARRTTYARWHNDLLDEHIERQRFTAEHLSRNQNREQGIDQNDGLEL
jgi:hypothetical protein